MQHFRYINTIRRPDGSLRPWGEYDKLSRYEDNCNDVRRDDYSYKNEATRIKNIEDNMWPIQMYCIKKSK